MQPDMQPYGVSLWLAGLHLDPIYRSRKLSAEPEPRLSILYVSQHGYFFGTISEKYILTDLDLLKCSISEVKKQEEIALPLTDILEKLVWEPCFNDLDYIEKELKASKTITAEELNLF